jgi:uncharacterized protein YuzE
MHRPVAAGNAMKMTYNPKEDTLRILFRNAPIHDSEVHQAGLILDFEQNGKIVGLELAAASKHITRPHMAAFLDATTQPEEEILTHEGR